MELIKITDLFIPESRQRKEFDEEQIVELSESIARSGLLHPVVVRRDDKGATVLVAGERRVKALDILWQTGQAVRCGTAQCPEGLVPCLYLGELDPIDAFEVELDENIRRTDLTWQERAVATKQLFELRQRQAQRDGRPAPTTATLAEEVHGRSDGAYQDSIRSQIIAAEHLDDPDVAKAPSIKEARKIIIRKEEAQRHIALGISVGATFSAADHRLIQGDCIEALPPINGIDVILSDPPYGMGADTFGDSAGKTAGAHFYDDSFESWINLMIDFIPLTAMVTKPEAHMYLFCDIDRFHELRDLTARAGWRPFRTPFIWVNPTAMRAPWPEAGPQRKWQAILYATKGNRPVTRLYGDVLTYSSDDNLGHQAQKPVGLYIDLLRRSIRPGDYVLDPFCGTGPIFPAAHEMKCRATGVEIDPASYGVAVKRLEALK